jgi:hypothetical protein
MKTCEGVELHLHHSWRRHYMEVSGQLHTLAALATVKQPPVPIM